jgi:hypothetical protein
MGLIVLVMSVSDDPFDEVDAGVDLSIVDLAIRHLNL